MTRRATLTLLAIVLAVVSANYAGVPAATPVPDQPRMLAARADLNKARASLQRARSNKDGHRLKAIEHINSAIAEINKGIAFDRRHNHAVRTGSTSVGATALTDQPNMQAALNHLSDANGNLDAATSDKGGHRRNAIGYVEKAISEVNKGIAAGGN